MPRLSRLSLLAALTPTALGGQMPAVDAADLRPARYVYEMTLTRDGLVQPLGGQSVTFVAVTYAGAPAWLILEGRDGGGIGALDSLIVSRDRFVPLRWGAAIGQSRMAAAFTRDSVYGAAASPLGRRSLVGPAPAGVIASEGMLDGIMRLARLDEGWTADVMLLVADLTGTRLIPAKVLVEREEEIDVPAGTFASWVVSVRTENGEKLLWVSKDQRIVVKSSQMLAQLHGAVLDRVLLRVDDIRLIPTPAVPLPGDRAVAAGAPQGTR